jgi:Tfp pilus assembly protein PilN
LTRLAFERGRSFYGVAFGRAGRMRATFASLAVAAAVSCLVAAAIRIEGQGRLLAATQDQLARGEAARTRRVATPRGDLSAKERRALDAIAGQLNTPWSQLLDALESSLPDGVALVSIEPNGTSGKVRIQAEARTLDALLVYAGTLRQLPIFESVTFVKHETNEQDANRPMRLVLEAVRR